MSELVIEKGIIIDDEYCVLNELRKLSGKFIDNLEIVKRFIISEDNTKFYFDNRMNSSTVANSSDIYLWLDTGFTDYYGKPIFISLLHEFGGYVGHITGTLSTLTKSAKGYFKQNRASIDRNIQNFINKYSVKSTERKVAHITDIQEYILEACNRIDEESDFSRKLSALSISYEDESEEILAAEENESEEESRYGFSKKEEEITIGLLLEKMDSMEKYVEELLSVIEHMEEKDQEEIAELRAKNEEYRRAMIEMRSFIQDEKNTASGKDESEYGGHSILGNHKKILVIGGEELGVNIMQGIAKTYGFEKKDLEFVEYDKAKDFTDRIRRDGRYSGIIIGSIPHSTSSNEGHSSPVERFKNVIGMPLTIDARSKSGKLKVTKESFRLALCEICQNLKMEYAC